MRSNPHSARYNPLTIEEAMGASGTERLTRVHVPAIQHLAGESGYGRCAVLHDDRGMPREVYFWGWSGD